MIMDNVVEIKKPLPDSHFVLLPCLCGSDNVAYVKYLQGCEELWRVQCFDCNRTVDLGTGVQHQVQVVWNDKMRLRPEKGLII